MNINRNKLFEDLKSSKDLNNKLKSFLPLIKQSNESIITNANALSQSKSHYLVEPLNNSTIDLQEDEQIVMDIHMGVFDINNEAEQKLSSMNGITLVNSECDFETEAPSEPLIREISSKDF